MHCHGELGLQWNPELCTFCEQCKNVCPLHSIEFSGSTFTYFLQPIATTVVLAMVFLGSVVIGRPVIARLAHDFCPISPEVARRPRVMRLFAGLTILWACVHVLSALTTFGMLVSLPVPLFVAVKTMSSFGLTAAAIVITVVWALRTAHQEELVFASL